MLAINPATGYDTRTNDSCIDDTRKDDPNNELK